MDNFRFNSRFVLPNYSLPPPNYSMPPPPLPYQRAANPLPFSFNIPPPPVSFNAVPNFTPPPNYPNSFTQYPPNLPNVRQPPPVFAVSNSPNFPPSSFPGCSTVNGSTLTCDTNGFCGTSVRPCNAANNGYSSNYRDFSAGSRPIFQSRYNSFERPHLRVNNFSNQERVPRRSAPRFSSHNTPHLPAEKRKLNDGGKNFTNTKKQKIDKRDLPENNKFSCEACDRGFKSLETFQQHVAGHIKCRAEDCKYSAHPKLVKLHYDTQHRTGLAKKIWSLQSKEELEKWKEERRRNYPTSENIERKKQERTERMARGVVVENKYFGKMRGRGGRGQQGRGRGFKGRARCSYTDQECSQESEGKLPELTGVASETNKSDDDAPIEAVSVKPASSNQDNSITDSGKENVVINEDNTTVAEPRQGREGQRQGGRQRERQRGSKKQRGKGGFNISITNVAATRRRPALLERLLANEIRHERNMVLQCVRYIAQTFNLTQEHNSDEQVQGSSAVSKRSVEEMGTSAESNAMENKAAVKSVSN